MSAYSDSSGNKMGQTIDETTSSIGVNAIQENRPPRPDAMDAVGSHLTNEGETSQPPTARFYLRICSHEGELSVADFAELQRLYHSGFVAPEDEVRREGSDIWQKAGAMFELRTVKPRPWIEGNEFALLAAFICALSLLLIFLFR